MRADNTFFSSLPPADLNLQQEGHKSHANMLNFNDLRTAAKYLLQSIHILLFQQKASVSSGSSVVTGGLRQA